MNLFEEIFQNSLDAKCVIDSNFNIKAYNNAFARIFGCERASLDTYFYDTAKIDLKIDFSGNSFDNEIHQLCYTNKGKTYYLEVSFLPLRKNNKIEHLCIFFKDITEKLLKEFAFQNLEIEKETILDNQKEFVILQDLDFNILWANKSAQVGSNLSLDEMRMKKCYEIWSDENSPCENCSVGRVKRTLKYEEFVRKTRNGIYWQIKATPIIDKDGNLHRILEIAENITEKKEQERIIAENEARYRNLARNAPVGIVVLENMKPVFANKKAFEITEFDDLETMYSTPAVDYVHPDDQDYFFDFIDKLKDYKMKEETAVINFRIIRNNKTKHIMATVSYFEVLNEQYYQIILLDNTELVELSAVQRKIAIEAVYLNEKNKLIEQLQKRHLQLARKYKFSDEDTRKLNKLLSSYFQPERDWEITKKHFEAVHKDFFTNLKKRFPNLTQNELRHCAYIRMNYTTKEIARILNVAPASVQKARLRLKKKMHLTEKDNLYLFIMSI